MTPRILVVDDDAAVRYTLRSVLEDAGMQVDEGVDGEDGWRILQGSSYDLVLTDLRMPNVDGLGLLDRVRTMVDGPRVILITAHGSERTAVSAIQRGAYDYFKKPFDPDELLVVVERAVRNVRLEANNERLEARLALSERMRFASAAMERLSILVRRVATKPVTVLITGESGTGKERLAEAVVQASPRAGRSFVRFNCAAINAELADAELFGHTAGAFTGATGERAGLFREADGGTLFLDEVAELTLPTQAKLLRVLQDGEVRPVGADRTATVDVRIIAATHRDLSLAVEAGPFREDLYYRLAVVSLHVPPLRDRPEDIAILAAHFLDEFSRRFGAGPFVLTDALRTRLESYSWPGNVRELRNVIESLVALSPPDALELPELAVDAARKTRATLAERLAAYERGLIVEALAAAGGRRTEAAKNLGIARATLYERLEKYGIEKQ